MPHAVWAEKFKTGHGFETRQRQQKCQRKPKVQSLDNQAVARCLNIHPNSNSNRDQPRTEYPTKDNGCWCASTNALTSDHWCQWQLADFLHIRKGTSSLSTCSMNKYLSRGDTVCPSISREYWTKLHRQNISDVFQAFTKVMSFVKHVLPQKRVLLPCSWLLRARAYLSPICLPWQRSSLKSWR